MWYRLLRRPGIGSQPPSTHTGSAEISEGGAVDGDRASTLLFSKGRVASLSSFASSLWPSVHAAEDTQYGIEVIRDSHYSLSAIPEMGDNSRRLDSFIIPAFPDGSSLRTSVRAVVGGRLPPEEDMRASGLSCICRSSINPVEQAVASASPGASPEQNREVLSQLASLQAEVAQLREQQEVQQMLITDAPPRYGEGP